MRPLLIIPLFIMSLLSGVFMFLVVRPVPRSLSVERGHLPTMPLSQNEPIAASSAAVSVMFVGDIQLDRSIRQVAERRGWDFLLTDEVRQKLRTADLVIGNLEGPITANPSVSLGSRTGERANYIFTFPPESAAFLARENIRLVNLGNNHILNFREEGVRETKQYLTQAGVQFFGSPLGGDTRISWQTVNGIRLAFVNYNQFIQQGTEKALADIAAARAGTDFVIVYTHWGEEYAGALDSVKMLAHAFVDAGADLVIGSHPHVIQEKEAYRGKMIYYSLGNFIFDQYFRPETREGLLVKAHFDSATKRVTTDELRLILSPTGQTGLASAPRSDE